MRSRGPPYGDRDTRVLLRKHLSEERKERKKKEKGGKNKKGMKKNEENCGKKIGDRVICKVG